MKIKKQHRLLSLVFSLALVISALGAGVPTSAENTAIDPITKVSMNLWSSITLTDYVGTAGNNLKDQFCDVRFVENNQLTKVKSNYDDWMAGFLFDSNVTNRDVSLTADGTTLTADSSANQTANYWQLLFKFDGVLNNPKQFVFGFHKTNNDFKASHYAVFASEKYEDLENSKIIDINDADGRKGDVINIDELNLNNIGYVEIRIYNTGSENWTQHITELGLFGGTVEKSDNTITNVTDTLTNTDSFNEYLSDNKNNLEGSSGTVGFYNNSKLTDEAGIFNYQNKFFDSDIASETSIGGMHKDASKCSIAGVSDNVFQTENYWQVDIKVGGELKNPQKFAVVYHHSSKTLVSKHYAVFASDNYSDLYDNKIIEIINSSERIGDVIDVSALNLEKVKYVGVRFYSCGFTTDIGCKTQHIAELGFFGGTVVKDNAITDHTVLSKNPDVDLSENRLAGSEIKCGFYSGDTLIKDCGLDATDAANFFDGVLSDGYSTGWDAGKNYTAGYSNDIFQTENYYQIQIELSGQLKSPDRFVLIGRKDGQFMSKHYAVFASDDLSNLYSDDNKIIEILDSTERAGDEIAFSGFDKIVKYVGIRFYHRGYTFDAEQGNTLQFINEIGLYGGLVFGPMGDMNMDTKVDILDLVRLKRYNADSTVAIDDTNELLVDFEGSSAQLAALRTYLLTGSWHTPTLFANEGYSYVWGDEFNAQTLNSDKWVNAIGKNDETMTSSNETNLTLEDGSLNLRVYGEKKKDGTTLYHVAEGLRTHSTMNFQYGYLEMRVKTPIQGGIGPAFWLTSLCGPETSTTYNSLTWNYDFKDYCTEVDILEQYRRTGIYFTTLHKWYPALDAVNDYHASVYQETTYKFDNEYHTYGFKWTPDEMSVYVDGAKYYSYDLSENFDKTGYNTTMDGFRSPHYLRITNDVTTDIEIEGGPELTENVNCTLSVDWIRLYQIPGVGGLWTK